MSDKNLTPDRAGSFDEDGLDVPTYHGDTGSPASSIPSTPPVSDAANGTANDATTQFPGVPGTADPFDRAGRAAPQEIPPAAPAPAPAPTAYDDRDFAAPGPAAHETFAYDAPPAAAPAPAPVQTQTGLFTGSQPAVGLGESVEVVGVEELPDHRRGTIDLGLLIVRLLLGLWLVLEAVGTFFRLGGNPGLGGLEADYANYLAPAGLSVLVPSMQLAAGVFLVLGLITPLLAMVATVATSFTALHALAASGAGLNIFAWPDTVWLSVVLLGVSLALQFTGPGLYSLDFGRSWARRPLISSWLFVALAIAGAVALWWFGAGLNPLA